MAMTTMGVKSIPRHLAGRNLDPRQQAPSRLRCREGRRQTARANAKKTKKKKPVAAADVHERGKAATPVVPMAALGMLNFESWAKGNCDWKKHVGIRYGSQQG